MAPLNFLLAAAAPHKGPEEDEVDCNWYNMQLGNNMGHWKPERWAIKYMYTHDLKGQEIKSWWPGKAKKGECNNVTDDSRGCWYRARLLNDPSCSQKEHCLHVAAHDGEPTHTYTCPTWLRDSEGVRCKLPQDWQACPDHFKLLRVDEGVPQEFREAIATPCPKDKPPTDPQEDAELKQAMQQQAELVAGKPLPDVALKQGGVQTGMLEVGKDAVSFMAPARSQGGTSPVTEQHQPEEPKIQGAELDPSSPPVKASDDDGPIKIAQETKDLVLNPDPAMTPEPDKGKDNLVEAKKPMSLSRCLGKVEGLPDVSMYFDLRHNQWYRCTKKLMCEKFDIKAIFKPIGKCGEHTCKPEETCVDHRVTSKESLFKCVPSDAFFVISAGDDMAKMSLPLPLALLPQPKSDASRHSVASRLSRCVRKYRQRSGDFL